MSALLLSTAASAQDSLGVKTMQPLTADADSTIDGVVIDEAEMQRQKALQGTHRNTAKGFNAMDYVLEKPQVKTGDTHYKWWHRHLFGLIGLGVERVLPPTDDYKYDALMSANIGIGRDISRVSTVRLLLDGAYGFQRQYDYHFFKGSAKLDYLFSISDYFNGYAPDRWVNVSTIAGLGIQYAKVNDLKLSNWAPEAHVGLQFRFWASPQASMTMEPYAGIAGDQIDISQNRNWRDFDFFYGIRLNFQYYFYRNNSPESKNRFRAGRYYSNYLGSDSVAASWRMPYFIEVANGAYFNRSTLLPKDKTLGNEWSLSVGKWIAPALGIRLSAFSRSSSWKGETVNAGEQGNQERHWHSTFSGGRIDALFNPLGLTRNYRWDRPFNFYLLLGLELGQITKYQPGERLSTHAQGYTGGVHLAARLSQDMEFFVEPRLSYLQYRVPFSNTNWFDRYHETGWNINAGLTVYMRQHRFERKFNPDIFNRHLQRFTIGVQGGLPLFQSKAPVYVDGDKQNYAYGAFASYSFNYVHGVRLGWEHLYHEYNSLEKGCPWYNKLDMNLLSLSYEINLTNALSGVVPNRKVELTMFLGPTLAPGGNDHVKGGGHLGFRAYGHLGHQLSVFVQPTGYLLNGLHDSDTFSQPAIYLGKRMSIVETLSIGLQFSFPYKRYVR